MQIVNCTVNSQALKFIPKEVPVNYEFLFCEQFEDNLISTLKTVELHSLSTEKFTKALTKCRKAHKKR